MAHDFKILRLMPDFETLGLVCNLETRHQTEKSEIKIFHQTPVCERLHLTGSFQNYASGAIFCDQVSDVYHESHVLALYGG